MSTVTVIQPTRIDQLSVGLKVQVHSFGSLYPGEVLAVKKSRVSVRYVTGGGPRVKTFKADEVIPGEWFETGRHTALCFSTSKKAFAEAHPAWVGHHAVAYAPNLPEA